MTFPEIAIEAAKRGLSIRIVPYGEGVGVYVVTKSGHEFAKAASDPTGIERLLSEIPSVFDRAAEVEAKGPPEAGDFDSLGVSPHGFYYTDESGDLQHSTHSERQSEAQ